MYADLHVHSTYSDGTDTPEELLALARDAGLGAIAIADHDTVEGVKAALGAGRGGVALIPAVEVSVVADHRFLHILGYGVDVFSPALARYIARASAEKTENTRVNFEQALKLRAFSYGWQRVLALNPGQPRISGVHVVRAMELDGYEAPGLTMRQLFHRYFRPESELFIGTETATVRDAIGVIRECGGIPVVAHPKVVGDDGLVLDMIRAGARGIEAHYPLHSAEETEKYLGMALEHDLLVTGGSDWHGGNNAPGTTRMGQAGLGRADFEAFMRHMG
jgi:predicted metal-dependent phosphoesterase TrpH